MIRPAAFAFNPETAVNNSFQKVSDQLNVHQMALQEFDDFVDMLRLNGIHVTVIQDTLEPHTPDSIFPNNWVSFHEDGTIVVYPMFAENRQLERSKNVIEKVNETFYIRTSIDLTEYENKKIYLEGTGSMVLDRDNEFAYACISPRTSPSVLYDFCDAMGYRPVLFNAVDQNGNEIYHTNVMMCLADEYVVICMDAITEDVQKEMLRHKFEETDKEIIYISLEQMNQFAGNMLQVQNIAGAQFLVMSTQAFNSLTEDQIRQLQSFNPIIHSSLNTIEKNGGGSARCMMAEIFLPLKPKE
ncbi:citrulline utilization hydrolase CtlX [Niabella ginsengisoli]|uniref:Arginine deiminase-related protein n=1 Tax=Niabella ginsengisoli TaxID=522298 RepID=A0ABS9SRJ1_9BACT|nr:arginine deiminase-related protein [Niabella ginsengisoli]MCH5600739.1 arginine deiminase-related protein [Niabella ginsengisoli]